MQLLQAARHAVHRSASSTKTAHEWVRIQVRASCKRLQRARAAQRWQLCIQEALDARVRASAARGTTRVQKLHILQVKACKWFEKGAFLQESKIRAALSGPFEAYVAVQSGGSKGVPGSPRRPPDRRRFPIPNISNEVRKEA